MKTLATRHTKISIGLGLLLALLLPIQISAQEQKQAEPEDLFRMTIEELMEVKVVSSAALAKIEQHLIPAAVTKITQEQIELSGARSITELLDIYVPNIQVMKHSFARSHIGIRGIIGDAENKYLLLVNGRVMNGLTYATVGSERDLSMLGDIHHIDIVRGPGSVVHGPGAVAGVINIITLESRTFEGTQVAARQGFTEQFTSVDIKQTVKFSQDAGLFFYYGLSDYPGADQEYSPLKYSLSDEGNNIEAGEPVPFDIPEDNRAYRSQLKHKLHLQFSSGNTEAWVRYTKGGVELPTTRSRYFLYGDPDSVQSKRYGYQQATAFLGHTFNFGSDINFDLSLSFDMFDKEQLRERAEWDTISYREDKYIARTLARWTPSQSHSLALGFEFWHGEFFKKSPGFPDTKPYFGWLGPDKPWSIDSYSIFTEYVWKVNEQCLTFLGARADKHICTDWLLSPRVTVVYSPTENAALKLIANRSVRRASENELRRQHLGSVSFYGTPTKIDEEIVNTIELRYERLHSDRLWFAGSAVYNDLEMRAYNDAILQNDLIGNYDTWGLEFEASYRTGKSRFDISHGFTKLFAMTLDTITVQQGYTAEPYGFGNDLAMWSNHVTKLIMLYKANERWTASTMLRVYWDFPGARDLVQYYNSLGAAFTDPGFNDAFSTNAYLDFGLVYSLMTRLSIRFDAYNVLGWIDEDLSKRNYILRPWEYRIDASALAVSIQYSF